MRADDRAELRSLVKKLYKSRSVFVHTGAEREVATDRQAAIDLMIRVIRHEMKLIVETAEPARP